MKNKCIIAISVIAAIAALLATIAAAETYPSNGGAAYYYKAASSSSNSNSDYILTLGAGVSVADPFCYRGGLGLSLSYGVDSWIGSHLSLMPAIGLRAMSENVIRSGWGIDLDDFYFADFTVSARYHFMLGGTETTVGVGPYIGYALNDDKYGDPSDPEFDAKVNSLSEIRKCDWGIKPAVTFGLGEHFTLGAELVIGLRNVALNYPEYSPCENRYLYSGHVTFGFKF